MVDFRYHLVSLVSVFLALAVGIILGAGPLQNSIGNALNSQVDTLRQSRDSLRAELEVAEGDLGSSNAALEAAGTQILPGTLTGRNVAIVSLPGANSDAVEAIEDQLVVAGATVSGRVKLTDNYASSAQSTYRSALVSQLREYVTSVGSDASDDAVVASAVDFALRTDPNDAGAKVVLGSLTASDNKLVDPSAEVTGAADAIVFVAPETYLVDLSDKSSDERTQAEAETKARTQIYARAFATSAENGPTVAVGQAVDDGDLLKVMRDQKAGSTVDSVGTTLAAVNTPLAVAAELTDTHVLLGVQDKATTVLGKRIDAAKPADAPAA